MSLSELAREHDKRHLREIAPAAWHRLLSYDWPGNLRELRNVVRLAYSQHRAIASMSPIFRYSVTSALIFAPRARI